MKIAKIFILFFILVHFFAAYTQNKSIDSLQKVLQLQKKDTGKVNKLIDLSDAFFQKGDFENSAKNAKEALSLSEKLNFKKGIANAYFNLGAFNTFQPDYNRSEALENLIKSLKIRTEIKDKKGIAYCYEIISAVYSLQQNYSEALKNAFAALKIHEELGDKQAVANQLQNIGAFFNDQNNNLEALKNYSGALKIREEIKDTFGIAVSNFSIAYIDFSRGNYSEALKRIPLL